MKVSIVHYERYPFYSLVAPEDSADWGDVCDVHGGTVGRWRAVMASFEAVQDEMEQALNQSAPTVGGKP